MEYLWKPSMSVGEEKLDKQHKKLLAEILKLEKILSSNRIDMGMLRSTNNFLYNYSREHFSYEEDYMAKIGYPKLEQHKKLHASFIKFYETLQKEITEKISSQNFTRSQLKALLKKVKNHLEVWLIKHILHVDKEYADYAKKHLK